MQIAKICTRRNVLRGTTAILIVALICSFGLWLMKPTIHVGRHWSPAERVNYGQVSHRLWDELLHRFVDDDGNVDYASWKASPNDTQKLNEYLDQLSRLDERVEGTRSQRIEFWVNAYNATTIKGILREYPTGSIQNHVAQFWGYNIWRDLRLIVGDKSYSLGEMEHSVLRPLREPRVHFAMVCGSRGCPRLRNEAYDADRLEDQLKGNTLAFFADGSKCAFDSERQELHLSPILKWYAEDFGPSNSGVLPTIADWLPEDIRTRAGAGKAKILFGEYDWSLNSPKNEAPPLPPTE